jgi:hypothetical protein
MLNIWRRISAILSESHLLLKSGVILIIKNPSYKTMSIYDQRVLMNKLTYENRYSGAMISFGLLLMFVNKGIFPVYCQ